MELIRVHGTESKNLKEALELLKENGFVVENVEPLRQFCDNEAEFRLAEMEIIDSEDLERLSEDETQELISLISDKFFEKEIFDYDYMDDLVREAYNEIIQDKLDLNK